jgi:hypothetical protein
MITFLSSIAYKIFKTLEASGQARARRFMSEYQRGMGKWQ